MTAYHFFLAIGLFIFALLVWFVTRKISTRRQLPIAPPSPTIPFHCPNCGSRQIDMLFTGLWSGRSSTGSRAGGENKYGTCLSCGSYCAQYDNDEPYVPSEKEWKLYAGFLGK